MKNNYQTNRQDDCDCKTTQLACTGTVTQDKKENIKFPYFAFLKISFAVTHTAHLLFPSFIFNGMPKVKEPNFAHPLKKILLSFIIGSTIFSTAFGQQITDTSNISKNTIYFEALGNGGIYSVNYDRILFTKKLFKISGGIGISYFPPSIRYNHIFTYPVEITFLYGRKNHLEVGIGYTPVFNLYNEDIFKVYDIYSYPVLRIGYRFQKLNGGFFFKTGLLLYFLDTDFTKDYSIYGNNKTWLGLGVGYTFKIK